MQQRTLRTFIGTALVAAAAQSTALAQIKLNELYVSHSGTDTLEFIELHGPGGASLDNYVVCVVEGESTVRGTLDRAWDLTGLVIPLDGHFVLGDTAEPNTDFNIGTSDRLENGTETFYLIDAGTASNVAAIVALLNTQLDADLDLITPLPTMGTIVDIVAILDPGATLPVPTDFAYDSAPTFGPDGTNFPSGILRGLDAPSPWCADFLAFDPVLNLTPVPRTPGATNSVCPSAPPSAVNYCTAGTTSNGCQAYMTGLGTPSAAAASGYTVTCNAAEGAQSGILFYGLSSVATAWGTSGSFLCVKSPLERMGVQAMTGTAGLCDGAMSVDFLAYVAANPSAVGTPFAAGNHVFFQGWFRDPPSPKTTHLSDGLDVTILP